METPSQHQPLTSPQTVLPGTVLVLTVAAFSATLWRKDDLSERGVRLINWLHNPSEPISRPHSRTCNAHRPLCVVPCLQESELLQSVHGCR